MKANKNLVTVDKANKVANITTTFSIPFKGWDSSSIQKATLHWFEVLNVFSGVIIKALEDRMDACVSMLSKNIFKVAYSDEYVIIFEKENGKYHNFNHASYKAMEDAINILSIGDEFNLELQHFEQIMKALVWVEVEDRKDIQGISFGNLISCIMESILVGAQRA